MKLDKPFASLYRCNVCYKTDERPESKEGSEPLSAWFSDEENNFHVCPNCLNTMGICFTDKKLVDYVIINTRLNNLGYLNGAYAFVDTPDICPTCLSVERTTVLARIMEKLESLLTPWQVKKEPCCGKCDCE